MDPSYLQKETVSCLLLKLAAVYGLPLRNLKIAYMYI